MGKEVKMKSPDHKSGRLCQASGERRLDQSPKNPLVSFGDTMGDVW